MAACDPSLLLKLGRHSPDLYEKEIIFFFLANRFVVGEKKSEQSGPQGISGIQRNLEQVSEWVDPVLSVKATG